MSSSLSKTAFRMGLLCAAVSALPAQVAAPPEAAGSDQIRVEKIELLDIQPDRIGFAVTPSIIPTQQVRVKTITFYGMRLNRIPIFIPPVSEELDLRPGVRAAPRRPLQVTVYLRDLSSLEPIIDLVRGGRVKIEGNALVEAKLDLISSVLMMKKTAHAPMRIDSDLPLDVPGGSLVRDHALQILTIAETGRGIVSKSLLYLLGADETQRKLQDRFGRSVMLAVARYEMTDSNHNRYPVEKMGVAFRVSDKQFVTIREMTEPWKFDSVIAMKMKRKELTMTKDSFDLLLWPAGTTYAGMNGKPIEGNAVTLRKHDFRISESPQDLRERIVATEGGLHATLVSTTPRASLSNLAVLEFDSSPKAGPPITDLDRKLNPTTYGELVAFRFAAGPFTKTVEPEIVRLTARVVNGRLVFDDPIDSSALGSPVVSGDGLVGIVQDETSAIGYMMAAGTLKLSTAAK